MRFTYFVGAMLIINVNPSGVSAVLDGADYPGQRSFSFNGTQGDRVVIQAPTYMEVVNRGLRMPLEVACYCSDPAQVTLQMTDEPTTFRTIALLEQGGWARQQVDSRSLARGLWTLTVQSLADPTSPGTRIWCSVPFVVKDALTFKSARPKPCSDANMENMMHDPQLYPPAFRASCETWTDETDDARWHVPHLPSLNVFTLAWHVAPMSEIKASWVNFLPYNFKFTAWGQPMGCEWFNACEAPGDGNALGWTAFGVSFLESIFID